MISSRRGAVVVASACLAWTWLACGASETSPPTSVAPALPVGDDGSSATGQDGTSPDVPGSPLDSGSEDIAPEAPGPPRVRFVGRFDARDPAGPWCAWPGCRVVARFDGTSVSVRLNERNEAWMQGGPSEWDVVVDGERASRLVLALGPSTYVLATDLAPGAHTVELYKRTEAQNGYTQFLGFDFTGGTLLSPPPAPTRRIEIIGDSAAAGFGIEDMGLGPNCPEPQWAARYQNFRLSFGARLGEILEADVTGTVYSGKGLAQNIWSDDPDTMPILYGRANPLQKASAFDTQTLVPDAIVVMIGGNDFAVGQPYDRGPATLEQFTSAYRSFVSTLRGLYPQARIWLAISPSLSDAQPAGRASRTNVETAVSAVVAERQASGDTRTFSIEPAVATPAELVACNGHGTPAYHLRIARELASVIRPALGW